MSVSPVEVTVTISVVSGAVGVVGRSLLLLAAGLTSMYAKAPARRKAAAELARLLATVPWHRGRVSDTPRASGPTGPFDNEGG